MGQNHQKEQKEKVHSTMRLVLSPKKIPVNWAKALVHVGPQTDLRHEEGRDHEPGVFESMIYESKELVIFHRFSIAMLDYRLLYVC